MIDSFLEDIAMRPEDKSTWLIMADWLEENNDPRHELARLLYQKNPDENKIIKLEKLHGRLIPIRKDNIFQKPMQLFYPCKIKNRGWKFEITHPFYISTEPITGEEYNKFKKVEYKENFHITGIAYNDVMAMMKWINFQERGDSIYTIPTELQLSIWLKWTSRREIKFDHVYEMCRDKYSVTPTNLVNTVENHVSQSHVSVNVWTKKRFETLIDMNYNIAFRLAMW